MKQRKYKYYQINLIVIIIIAFSFILMSCQTLRTRSDSSVSSDGIDNGIVYYLPKHQVKVSGTATYKDSRFVNKALELETKRVRTGVTAAVTLELVRDIAHKYTFDMSPSLFYENNFTVDVNSKGFLTGFNALSTGKVGEGIKSVASIIGKVLPLIGLLGEPEGSGKEAIDKMVKNNIILSAQREALFKGPYVTQHYIISSKLGRERWIELFKINASVKSYQSAIRKSQEQLLTTTVKDIDDIGKQLAALRKELKNLQALKETVKQAFDAGLASHKTEHEIGDVTSTYDFVYILELTEIPDADKFKAGELKADVGKTMMNDFQCDNNSCPKYEKIWDIWTKFGFLITVDPYTVVPVQNRNNKNNDHDFTIYHRQSSLHRLSVYQVKKGPKNGIESEPHPISKAERLVLQSSDLYQLMHPSAEKVKIGFDKNAFAKRNVILTFDVSTGGLSKFQRQDDAAFEKAAASINTALNNGIESYSNILTKIKAIKDTEREIRLDKLRDEVDRLKQEKLIIDNEVALEGATATRELKQKKDQIDAELALRTQEIALGNLELDQSLKVLTNQLGQLQKQFEIDKLGATAGLQIDGATLAQQLTNIQNQINISKATTTQEQQILLLQLTTQVQILGQQLTQLQTQQKIDELEKAINE